MSAQTLLYCPPLHRGERPLLSLAGKITLHETALSATQQANAAQLIRLWQQHSVSRYNRYPDASAVAPAFVLLVLQQGQALALRRQMLQFAIELAKQQPQCEVVLCHDQHKKIAPALLAEYSGSGVSIKTADKVHHAALLAQSSAVITADSWLGFEALLWQKKVFTFGSPFYAHLGLTSDQNSKHTAAVTLPQLVHQVLLEQSRAVDIETGKPASIADAITWLGLQRLQRNRYANRLYAIGFNYHWRSSVKAFLQGSEVIFVRQPQQVPAGHYAVVWGRRDISAQLQPNVKLLRLEDGFLRSVGLGAQFVKPLSWVLDDTGLYFDATTTSALEVLLSQHPLDDSLQQRSQLLITQLVQHGISKYNTGQQHWQRPDTDKKIILVPGQVESDASIKFGAPDITTNIALLQAVRAANPNAYIIYKPHPDVQAGARAAGLNEHNASQFCDQLAHNVNIAVLLDNSDEVHVLTSLAGFEALLRGKTVHCYGLPFYAGWGLTLDHCYCPRRQRKLNLTQLVAASLLLYPLYVSSHSGYYTTPEHTLQQLVHWRSLPVSFRQKCKNQIRFLISKMFGAK
ncbi:capsular polysaccharide export protein [Rheinheimera pacifica]|uniref:capsular polysaccharide biosynthesis protein n=1 Tax=Rheinheimera pacifica TaxID=173990 RepID=UPI0028674851|nr:capsular polysaccharide biosynthesis protein [Rheinheimera pacifica]MDR6984029.1 capsular polysaccharide export protein [Rheinheimera pacifica]